ncbi:MAG TPA: polysaccharide biosynthesis tyrosine autokinase [Verrucomicrobiae bacterium]
MNNQPGTVAEDRHVQTGKFFARLYRYRNLLLRRWWVLILCIGAAIAIEVAQIRLTPPMFVSVGQMIVSIKLNIQQGSLYTEELGNFLGTQAALMQGAEVSQRARDRIANQNPNLTPKPISQLTVNILPKTTIFVLRATGESPDYTKAYLQACMDEYINLKKQMVARTSDTTIAGLTEQVLRLEPELQKCDAEMQSFLSTNDAALLEQASGLGGYLTSIYQRLADVQAQAQLLQTMTLDQSLLLEQGHSPVIPSAAGGTAGVLLTSGLTGQSDGGFQTANTIGAEYLTVKQQILLLQTNRLRFAEYLKPKHPQMEALDLEIEKLNQVLNIYQNQSLEQMEARKTALALQITNLETQARERGRENLEISRKAAQYERLKAKASRVQSLYDQLIATLQTLDVNKEISPESVTVYQPASDAQPDQTQFKKALGMAGALGLAVGLLILFLLDRVDDRMNSFTELEELFEENVLGQIPREHKKGRAGIIPALQPDDQRHPFVEAYRNLRSSLLYMNHSEPRPRCLLVTSSVPGDGKSLTATNLAITMAMGGSRVLLVDADLRKGNLHNRLEVDPKKGGVSEVFTQGVDWRGCVAETKLKDLYLLPRGTTTQRSSEFFIGPAMETFLKEVREAYDYVVIDTAPVMAADDVTSLAPRVDGVLFVVRAEHTSARVARAALNMLYQRKAKVLGLVFNSVHVSVGDYYYYYRYSDYHKA